MAAALVIVDVTSDNLNLFGWTTDNAKRLRSVVILLSLQRSGELLVIFTEIETVDMCST
jgi:hypothetical protein